MALIRYDGPRGTTWGFRFWYRGRVYKQMVGRSKELAREAEKRERRRLEKQTFERQWGTIQPRLTPWPEAVEKYLAAKADKRSLQHDQWRLTWWTAFFASRKVHHLQDLEPTTIDEGKAALAKAGKGAATVQRYLAVLRHLCQLAVRRWEMLERNPVLAVDWPRVRRQAPRIPTQAERQALLAKADQILRPIVLTALYTGLRRGAILQLQAEDFRARPGWLRCSDRKGGKEYFLPVPLPLARMIRELGVVSGPLFRDPDGKPLHRFPRERWEKARGEAGLAWLTFHNLRHTCGTVLAEAKVPQRSIQAWLAHSSGQVTEVYTVPQETGLLEAAEALAESMGV